MAQKQRPIEIVRAGLKKRHASERRFKLFGKAAIAIGLAFLVVMFFNIVAKGYGAFQQTFIKLPVYFDPQEIDPTGARDRQQLSFANYAALIRASLQTLFPEVEGRAEMRRLNGLISSGADFLLRRMVLNDPSKIGTRGEVWVPANDDVDMLNKGYIDRAVPESERRVSDQELAWIDKLAADGRLERRFNTAFFTNGDSREPELAGIRGAVMGSFFTLIVTLALSFPLGVATAIYLEEFAPRNRWSDLIEVNINNLAAVPSIVFGLLGLAVFINFFGLPRSTPVVGGLVLTLMTLPTIIIAGRAALKSVPPSIKEAALGIGASRMQTMLHHVLPVAMPGMLTGTIIGMAQALGETAPLLMIGMVAFIVDVPGGITEAATVLPVQIFLWADSPERA
ncbi:MAG TPA: PstA family ABC transporter permease, partial [Candidatus Binatia bacterium]|nr:PstA family ABC transporter permease [Candidatus Binatia bacterium]